MQLRHDAWITGARFSAFVPHWLITADNAGTLRVHDVEADTSIVELRFPGAGHMYAARRVAAALSPCGDRLAIARTEESTIRFYSISKQRFEDVELRTVKPVHDLAFAADGTLVAGTYYGGLRVFRAIAAGAESVALGSKTAKIEELRMSAGGTICLRYGYRKWRSMHLRRELAPQAHRQIDAGDCSDEVVAIADDHGFQLRRRGKHKREYRVTRCSGIAVAGSEVFVATPTSVKVFDIEGMLIHEQSADFRSVSQIVVSPDGKRLAGFTRFAALRSGGHEIDVLNLASRVETPLTQSGPAIDVRWHPEGPVTVDSIGVVHQWRRGSPIRVDDVSELFRGRDTEALVSPSREGIDAQIVAATKVGGHQAALSDDGVVIVTGRAGPTRLLRPQLAAKVASIHAAPSDRVLLRTESSLELRDVPSLDLVQSVRRETRALKLSRHGTFWVEQHADGFRFYDPRDIRRPVGELAFNTEHIVDFDVLPDERVLLATELGALYLVSPPMAGPVANPEPLIQLDQRLLRVSAGEQHAQNACQLALLRSDGIPLSISIRLPRREFTSERLVRQTRAAIDGPLTTDARAQLDRLGATLGSPWYQREIRYPDGVYPVPFAIRELLGATWPSDRSFVSVTHDAWKGIFGRTAPETFAFDCVGLDKLSALLNERALTARHLLAFGHADDALLAVDLDSSPNDPTVHVISEDERTRTVQLSTFLERLRPARDSGFRSTYSLTPTRSSRNA